MYLPRNNLRHNLWSFPKCWPTLPRTRSYWRQSSDMHGHTFGRDIGYNRILNIYIYIRHVCVGLSWLMTYPLAEIVILIIRHVWTWVLLMNYLLMAVFFSKITLYLCLPFEKNNQCYTRIKHMSLDYFASTTSRSFPMVVTLPALSQNLQRYPQNHVHQLHWRFVLLQVLI